MLRPWCALHVLTWKCASRHNGVHFFDNFQKCSDLVCCVHFDLEMCFAPQRRPNVRHLNFQKWSETVSFFTLLTSRASRHNGVQLFISHLARWLRTRRFSQPTFRPYKSLEKHSVSPLCYLFAHLHLLSSDSFSSLIFIFLLFSSLTLPTSAFPSVHIVGSLTSKLPSIIGDLPLKNSIEYTVTPNWRFRW